MSYQPTDSSLIQKWVDGKLSLQEVEGELLTLGCDENTRSTYLKEFKKIRNAKRQFNGFIYLGVGAFSGFLSCVLTLTNPVPELYNWILYGLTSVSILLICRGLYYLFE